MQCEGLAAQRLAVADHKTTIPHVQTQAQGPSRMYVYTCVNVRAYACACIKRHVEPVLYIL